jgi:uncharacterized phage protein (TIGR02220 family)
MKKNLGGYYIKARNIENSKIFSAPPQVRELWDYLIRKANHSDNHVCKRGQHVTNINKVLEDLSWYAGWRKESYKKHSMENAMKWLRGEGMIITEKTTRGTVITICNYDYFQDPKNYESRTDNYRKADHVPEYCRTINKNEEEDKKEINILSGKPDSISEIINLLNLKAGTKFKPKSANTVKLINARLKEGYEISDFEKVIDKKCKDWLPDPKMCAYVRPITLFGTKFESYLNEAQAIDPDEVEAKRIVGEIKDLFEDATEDFSEI